MSQKQVVSTLVSIYFDSAQLGHPIKAICTKFQSRDVPNFNFLGNGLGLVSTPYFVYDFSKKNISVIFYQLTKVHCLIAFTA